MPMSHYLRERGRAYADNTVATLLFIGVSVFVGWIINHFAPLWGLDPHVAYILAWIVALLVAIALSLLLKPKHIPEAKKADEKHTELNSARINFSPVINIDNNPVFQNKPEMDQRQVINNVDQHPTAEFTFEVNTLWIRTLPMDFRANTLGRDERPENALDDRYERNVRVALARFEYETTTGVARDLDVRAQITVFNDTSLCIPKYDAVWYGAGGRSKRFRSGDFDELILAVLTTNGMAAYEYNLEAYPEDRGKYLCPRLNALIGEEFFLNTMLIGSQGKVVMFKERKWFSVKPNDPFGAFLVGLAKPPPHLW